MGKSAMHVFAAGAERPDEKEGADDYKSMRRVLARGVIEALQKKDPDALVKAWDDFSACGPEESGDGE
jgi:excinuclease UvrABC nuclease subunit